MAPRLYGWIFLLQVFCCNQEIEQSKLSKWHGLCWEDGKHQGYQKENFASPEIALQKAMSCGLEDTIEPEVFDVQIERNGIALFQIDPPDAIILQIVTRIDTQGAFI